MDNGKFVKMILTAFSDAKFSSQVGSPYEVQINPETYNFSYSIEYLDDKQAPGSVGLEHKFKRINPCLLYTSPSPRDMWTSRMPSSA